jgi:antitoxin MazE
VKVRKLLPNLGTFVKDPALGALAVQGLSGAHQAAPPPVYVLELPVHNLIRDSAGKFLTDANPLETDQGNSINLYKHKGEISMPNQAVRKWGNNLGVRIPLKIAQELKLSEGAEVECFVADDHIALKPTRRRRKYILDELIDAMPTYEDREETDLGPPIGEEVR